MNATNVKFALEAIRKTYGKRDIGILSKPAEEILDDAILDAESTWDRFRKPSTTASSWGYEISTSRPLCFAPSEVLNGAVVDISCKLRWSKESSIPSKQDIRMRIWSEHADFVYRSNLDSECVEAELTDPARMTRGRVISRFHFDRVDNSQGESKEFHPKFHIQIGGKPDEDELYWHPKKFDLPRIPHHPMELLLTCQFVAINFFPEKYGEIRKDTFWKRELLATQKSVVETYYEQCLRTVRNKVSLLDALPTICTL